MSYQLLDEDQGLVFRFSGNVNYGEITIANQKGWEHPGWDKHQYQIWDFCNAKQLDASELEAKMTASMDKVHTQRTRPMKFALVSDNEQIIKLLEVYVAISEGENMEAQIFTDEASARDWISV